MNELIGTVYYDLEADNEHPPYVTMSLFGALVEYDDGRPDEVHVWEAPFTTEKMKEIEKVVCDRRFRRVGFNNLNYDDLVSTNYGVQIPEENTHDAYIAIKTVHPELPAFGLKFLCWHLLGDFHWEEFELKQSGSRFGTTEVSDKLRAYHRKDLYQHRDIWKYVRDDVFSARHREAYELDMGMKFPLEEMTFEGGVLVDVKKCSATLDELAARKAKIQEDVQRVSEGKIKNANSNKQVSEFLSNVEDWQLNLTETGEFQLKKKDLCELLGVSDEEALRRMKPEDSGLISPVALLAWQMKDIETQRKYVQAYYTAATSTGNDGWIPAAYQVSRAGTRRTLSKSFHKINFQNSTEFIDGFKLIPPGYLGWFIDSTQIENVVHIYETNDISRRMAYEEDENWNEYVWLCNRILGTTKTKKELDSIKSKQVPHWSVYKVYKTIKLALNFGMGVRKFCKDLGLDEKIGRALFEDIHRACPAIRLLQNYVEEQIRNVGYVQDTFGHIYTGPVDEAYKVVAYLIQGCGTGSLPKAQLRANYETLHRWSRELGTNVGPLTNTTHDEQGGLLRLDLGEEVLSAILSELMENMTTKFSHKFDGIPLRGKLYLSTTNWKDRKDNEQPNWRQHIEFPIAA